MAAAETDSAKSGMSDPMEVGIDPNQLIDPSGMYIEYQLDGIRYAQGLNDLTGCSSVLGGEWDMRIHPDFDNPTVGETTTFHVPVLCPSGSAAARLEYQGGQVPLADEGRGVFRGTFEPGAGGSLRLVATCSGVARTYELGTVSLEYNGFIFNASRPDPEPTRFRIEDAEVRLFQLVPGTGWVLWDGQRHFGQTNPQTTGVLGWYGFYPPPGLYRAQVTRRGFADHITDPVQITTQPFMLTIGLQRRPLIYLPALKKLTE
jgi:hypothetical protein